MAKSEFTVDTSKTGGASSSIGTITLEEYKRREAAGTLEPTKIQSRQRAHEVMHRAFTIDQKRG